MNNTAFGRAVLTYVSYSVTAVSINPADWPALDLTPPTNSSQVQEWISQIDWSQVPDIPVNQPGGCANATNAEALQNASANGWWTCGGHTRSCRWPFLRIGDDHSGLLTFTIANDVKLQPTSLIVRPRTHGVSHTSELFFALSVHGSRRVRASGGPVRPDPSAQLVPCGYKKHSHACDALCTCTHLEDQGRVWPY